MVVGTFLLHLLWPPPLGSLVTFTFAIPIFGGAIAPPGPRRPGAGRGAPAGDSAGLHRRALSRRAARRPRVHRRNGKDRDFAESRRQPQDYCLIGAIFGYLVIAGVCASPRSRYCTPAGSTSPSVTATPSTTVGYGDVLPNTAVVRIRAALDAVAGVLLYIAILIGCRQTPLRPVRAWRRSSPT
jgi:hypothetical protein